MKRSTMMVSALMASLEAIADNSIPEYLKSPVKTASPADIFRKRERMEAKRQRRANAARKAGKL